MAEQDVTVPGKKQEAFNHQHRHGCNRFAFCAHAEKGLGSEPKSDPISPFK